MAINQVQFQQGLSMAEFLEQYGTEEKVPRGIGGFALPRGLPAVPSAAMSATAALFEADAGIGSVSAAGGRAR